MNNNSIINWINNFNGKKMLFITGKEGVGKKTFIKNNFSNDYDILFLDFISINNNDIKKNIKLKNINTNVMIGMKKIKKQMIVLTEVEHILPKNINMFLKDFFLNNKKKISRFPIILIGNGKCKQHLNYWNNKIEHIIFKGDKNFVIDNIRLTYNLNNNKDNQNTNELYNNIQLFFTKKLDYEIIKNIVNKEKILFPLLIHENFKKFISKYKIRESICDEIIDIFVKTDNIYEYIFKTKQLYLFDKYIYINCYKINILINKFNNGLEKKIDYTKILTKNSLLLLYNKYLKIIKNDINIIHDFDNEKIYHIMRIIIYDYMSDKKTNVLKKYSLNKKNINKILHHTNTYYINDHIKEIKNNYL